MLTPTARDERYGVLDALRGAALFGIVTGNMALYSLYAYLPQASKAGMPMPAVNRVFELLELVFIDNKGYMIFSVLFGIGFSILLSRSHAKEIVFHRFFLRRVFFLFLIGAAHALLVWPEDILETYAVCGVLLLPFVRVRTRPLLTVAALALLAPIPMKLLGGIHPDGLLRARDAMFHRFGFTPESVASIYSGGSYGDVVHLNAAEWFATAWHVIASGMIFRIFGCFLLGLWLGRSEIYKRLDSYRPVLKRLAVLGMVVGLPLNIVFAKTFGSHSWRAVLSSTLGVPALSASYVSFLCLVWLRKDGPELLRIFTPVGRMALTNYVGQSVVCTLLLFCGTGLGLGGKVGPVLYLPMAAGVYVLQVFASHLWFSRFRYGPLEWLWRMLTYGQWLTLAKPATG